MVYLMLQNCVTEANAYKDKWAMNRPSQIYRKKDDNLMRGRR